MKQKDELFAIAREQSKERKKVLASFVLSRSAESLDDLIDNTWQMENSIEKLTREKLSRLEIIEKASKEQCAENCDGQWFQSAYEVLSNNHIHPYVFADSLCSLIIKGNGKLQNILLIGPAGCGKTFMLKPLELTVCFYHVTYAFQSESTLYSCLNVKELLARSRREI